MEEELQGSAFGVLNIEEDDGEEEMWCWWYVIRLFREFLELLMRSWWWNRRQWYPGIQPSYGWLVILGKELPLGRFNIRIFISCLHRCFDIVPLPRLFEATVDNYSNNHWSLLIHWVVCISASMTKLQLGRIDGLLNLICNFFHGNFSTFVSKWLWMGLREAIFRYRQGWK